MTQPFLLLGLLCLLACDEGGGPGARGDSAEDDPAFTGGGDLTLTVGTEEESYVLASWTSDVAGRTRLEFADEAGPVLVTDWQEGPNATAVPVVGLWVSGEFTASLVDEAGHVLDRETVTTGPGLAGLNVFTASGQASWSGYLLTSLLTPELPAAIIVAPNGKVVWYKQVSGQAISRVIPRADGLGVWVLVMPGMANTIPGLLYSYAWDGSELLAIQPSGHEGEGITHDLVVTEDDKLLFLAIDSREYEGVKYTGESLYSMNTDGTEETELWSFWDLFAPNEYTLQPDSWTHANALRWSEETGTLFVGSRELSTIVEIDPDDWMPIHVLGGDFADLHLEGGGELFHKQHGFELRGNRLAIHDNRDAIHGTRMVVYDLNRGAKTAVQSWDFMPNPALYDYVLGDVNWVDDDTIIANWSTSGLIEERDLDGTVPWSLTLDLGAVLGYSDLVDALPGSTQVAAE